MDDILLLGANGQLGNDLRQILMDASIKHLALSRSDIDILDSGWQDKLTMLAPNCRVVINCIAYTNVDKAEDDAQNAFAINAIFPYQLAKFCAKRQITLIHFSTDYVFSGINDISYHEQSIAKPINIYGLSKYAGDIAIEEYHDKYFIFRVSALFGKKLALAKGGNFISTMQRLYQERDIITVIDDQFTCPTATLAVARCVCHFLQHEITEYGLYNCVSSNACSWFEFATAIFNLNKFAITKLKPISYADYSFKARRPQYSRLNTDKLKQFYMMPTWQTSLAEYFS